MTRKKTTKHPGVARLKSGEWRIRVTRVAQIGHQRHRNDRTRVLPASTPIEEVLRVRAELLEELTREADALAREIDPGHKPTTLSDFAERWLVRRAPSLRVSVREHYVDILGRRVLPELGNVPIAELDRTHMRAWVRWAESQRSRFERPYAEATLHSWWRVLCTLVRDAAAECDIPDPTARVEPPKSTVRKVREGVTLTPNQLRDLLDAVAVHFESWVAEVSTLAFTGVRAGELYALQWDDVDQDLGVIHVRRAHWKGHVGATKTDDPRDVALTTELRTILAEHRQRQLREQHPGLEAGLVFPAAGGNHRGAPALTKVLRLCAAAAGIPTRVTPQVLRRTFNTLLVQAGVPGVVLRAQMGHTTEAMTRRYAGIQPEAKRAAVDALHRLVRPSDPDS